MDLGDHADARRGPPKLRRAGAGAASASAAAVALAATAAAAAATDAPGLRARARDGPGPRDGRPRLGGERAVADRRRRRGGGRGPRRAGPGRLGRGPQPAPRGQRSDPGELPGVDGTRRARCGGRGLGKGDRDRGAAAAAGLAAAGFPGSAPALAGLVAWNAAGRRRPARARGAAPPVAARAILCPRGSCRRGGPRAPRRRQPRRRRGGAPWLRRRGAGGRAAVLRLDSRRVESRARVRRGPRGRLGRRRAEPL